MQIYTWDDLIKEAQRSPLIHAALHHIHNGEGKETVLASTLVAMSKELAVMYTRLVDLLENETPEQRVARQKRWIRL